MFKVLLNKLSPNCTEISNFINSVSRWLIFNFLVDIFNCLSTFWPLCIIRILTGFVTPLRRHYCIAPLSLGHLFKPFSTCGSLPQLESTCDKAYTYTWQHNIDIHALSRIQTWFCCTQNPCLEHNAKINVLHVISEILYCFRSTEMN
jgi:hypothetical protein